MVPAVKEPSVGKEERRKRSRREQGDGDGERQRALRLCLAKVRGAPVSLLST